MHALFSLSIRARCILGFANRAVAIALLIVAAAGSAGVASAEQSADAFAVIGVTVGNVREAPRLGAKIIDRVSRGDRVHILDCPTDEWCLVETPNRSVGYVHRSLLLDSDPASPLKAASDPAPSDPWEIRPGEKLTVRVSVGRFRQAPSLESEILFRRNAGAQVEVLDTRGDWYQVRTREDQTAWAHHSLFCKPGPKPAPSPDAAKRLEEIHPQIEVEGEERVLFHLNGFYPPEMFAIEGNQPRIVCDFLDTVMAQSVPRRFDVGGRLIQNVRSAPHGGDTPKTRVVLDLAPQKDYAVRQVFFKEENVFAVIVTPASPVPGGP